MQGLAHNRGPLFRGVGGPAGSGFIGMTRLELPPELGCACLGWP